MTASAYHSPSFLALLAAASHERALAEENTDKSLGDPSRVVHTRQTGVVQSTPTETVKLAPYAPTTATGRERLPSVEDVFKFFAEGTNETPPPSSVFRVSDESAIRPPRICQLDLSEPLGGSA